MQHILLLDDEPSVLTALKRVLRTAFGDELGVDATTVPDVALGLVKSKTFDVIVSDYRMPVISGSEFLRIVRAIQPDAVRMILSASSESGAVMHSVNDAEVFRYILKPWTETDIVAQIKLALQIALERRRQRELADVAREKIGEIDKQELERRRLESLEPGITHVEWGPSGEVLLTPDIRDPHGT